jgi:hypothetical protein
MCAILLLRNIVDDYEFIGVCRSKKNNCKHNYSVDISNVRMNSWMSLSR